MRCWHGYEKERRGVRVAGCSRNIVLVCEECGERTVLVGALSAWRTVGTAFECGCGEAVTLADGLDQETTELANFVDAQKIDPRR
jgi:hypothetical protein